MKLNSLPSRIFHALASLRLAVVVMVTLGLSCLTATIYESKHGTAAAQREFYRTGWFAAILTTLGINIFCAMMSRYPWKKHHTGFVLAHIGILILLAGSLISLHFGMDGNMALYEGDTTDRVRLLDKVVDVETTAGARTRLDFDFEKSPPRPDHPRRFPLKGGDGAALVVEDFTPHVRITEGFAPAAAGPTAIHFVLQAPFATQDAWLVAGDSERDHLDFGPAAFDFSSGAAAPVPPAGRNHVSFWLRPDGALEYRLSATHADSAQGPITVGKGIDTPWMGMKVSVDKLLPHARMAHEVTPDTPPAKDERRIPAIKVRLEKDGATSAPAWLAWAERVPLELASGGALVAYHAPEVETPFRVTLLKFNSDKYPGSSMAATYESYVRVDDPDQGPSEHHISMNHPLHYRGYIFFQASFVEGQPMMSIFSVARAPGLPLVYLGTTLISCGVVWMFYVKPYLARRQAAAALAAHQARQEGRHAQDPESAAAPASSAGSAEPASGRA